MTQAISAPSKRDLLFLFFGMALLMLALPGRASAQTSHIVSCSSGDMHYHTCSVGPNSGIRLVRQRSESPCERGRSYGVRGNQIWVDHGCRAEFEVLTGNDRSARGRNDRDRDDRGRNDGYQNGRGNNGPGYGQNGNEGYRGDRGNNGPGGPTRAVVCGSNDMHLATCNIGPNRGVRVLRQMSESPCRLGRTFGVRGNQLWVDRGCRAQFEVFAR
jgi:Protein of unknown function (DUF3011)